MDMNLSRLQGESEGQGSLARCSPRGCKKLDTTEGLNITGDVHKYCELRWTWQQALSKLWQTDPLVPAATTTCLAFPAPTGGPECGGGLHEGVCNSCFPACPVPHPVPAHPAPAPLPTGHRSQENGPSPMCSSHSHLSGKMPTLPSAPRHPPSCVIFWHIFSASASVTSGAQPWSCTGWL